MRSRHRFTMKVPSVQTTSSQAEAEATGSRKAVREAITHFETNRAGVRRGSSRYSNRRRRIEHSLRPMATAKAIIKDLNKANLRTGERGTIATIPDLSDVQELRVRLIHQHHWLDPQVRGILHRLDVKAATGELLVDDLEHAAEIVGAFKHTVPGAWRRDERSTQIA